MKRLYFLTDTIDTIDHIAKELHAQGVKDWNFHVNHRDEAKLAAHHIPTATPLQKTDLIHTGERGALVGILGGMLLALAIALSLGQPLGLLASVGIVLLVTCFGGWLGGMVGLSHQNYRMARFQREIEAGKYLIMVDIHPSQSSRVHELFRRYQADTCAAGEDGLLVNPLARA